MAKKKEAIVEEIKEKKTKKVSSSKTKKANEESKNTTKNDGLTDIIPSTKKESKHAKKQKNEDIEVVESDLDVDKELGKYISDQLFSDEQSSDEEEDISEEDLKEVIAETKEYNKGKNGKGGKKIDI